MAPHPKSQTKADRTETWRMIDAFRKVETELHHRLIELRTIPPEWDGIHERRAERASVAARAAARYEAWKAKAAEADAKGEPRPPLL